MLEQMIRERLPHATIITFWHVPWPNAERIGICPWREELIAGMLGSSVVGFHTQLHCNNFIDSVDAFMESRIDRETNAVVQGEQRTLVRPYPISIEWPVHWLDEVPPVAESRRLVREEPAVAARLLRDFAGLVRRLSERVIDLSTLGVHQRLHAELLRLAREAGVQGNRARIDPAPKHADLASQVSTYREQVTRELSALAKAGLIGKDGKALLVLDVARLERLVKDVRAGS